MDKQFPDELNIPQRMSLGTFILCIILDFLMQSKTTLDDWKAGRTSLVKDGEKSPSGIAAAYKPFRSYLLHGAESFLRS